MLHAPTTTSRIRGVGATGKLTFRGRLGVLLAGVCDRQAGQLGQQSGIAGRAVDPAHAVHGCVCRVHYEAKLAGARWAGGEVAMGARPGQTRNSTGEPGGVLSSQSSQTRMREAVM